MSGPADTAPRRAPLQARAKATWDAILEATAALLVERGYEGVNTNAVAERAGVKPPAVYRYFPNKFALYHALAEKLQSELDVEIDTALADGDRDTLENVIARLLDRAWGFWRRRPAFVALWYGEWSIQGAPSPALFFGERTVSRLAGATARFRHLGFIRERLVLAAAMQMAMAMLTVGLIAPEEDKEFMVTEAKRALLAYLKPVQGAFS
jgi:AcrR family transcriptional regulator